MCLCFDSLLRDLCLDRFDDDVFLSSLLRDLRSLASRLSRSLERERRSFLLDDDDDDDLCFLDR